MSAAGETITISAESPVQWRAILAGTAAAAGLSFALHAFAAAVGLSLTSTAPTWRDSNAFFWTLSGVYLLFVAIAAFAVGGYMTARLRTPMGQGSRAVECNEGILGSTTWGLAILVTAVLALGGAALTTPAMAPSGAAGASQSVAGENIIASELDELLRDARGDAANLNYRRAEAARILLKANSHDGIPAQDRDYLVRLTTQVTGVEAGVAQDRVQAAITASRQELRRARIAAVLQAFFIGAALMVGAAVAWLTAVEGGKDREAGTFFAWPARRPQVRQV
jgi:hypothetical protein